MKKVIAAFLVFTMLATQVFADCPCGHKKVHKSHVTHTYVAKRDTVWMDSPCKTSFWQTKRGRCVIGAAALGAGFLIGRANRKEHTDYVYVPVASCPPPQKKGCK